MKDMPQHGFARTSSWQLESSLMEEKLVSATFSLIDNDVTFSLWPHRFKLEYTITLSSDQLKCSLRVKNIDTASFNVHTLLHTYLKVSSILSIRVTGFKDSSYVDKLKNSCVFIDTREVASIDCEVDRVMTGSGSSLLPDTILDFCGHGFDLQRVTLTVSAFLLNTETQATTPLPHDVVFWNPWIDKSIALLDLGDEDYKEFVCIEPGTTSDWVTVLPTDELNLTQTLTSFCSSAPSSLSS